MSWTSKVSMVSEPSGWNLITEMITLVRNQIEKAPEKRKAVRSKQLSIKIQESKVFFSREVFSGIWAEKHQLGNINLHVEEQGCWVLLDVDQCNVSLVIRGAPSSLFQKGCGNSDYKKDTESASKQEPGKRYLQCVHCSIWSHEFQTLPHILRYLMWHLSLMEGQVSFILLMWLSRNCSIYWCMKSLAS